MPIAKKYKAAIALFDREAQYTPTEAAELIKKTASAKFDESIDLAIRLGVDPRKADQAVRGTVALPAGSGKTLRIAVFAAGDAANEARAAGADVVIVFPHWGLEFQAQPTASQRRFAKVAIIAGADMILGSHSHWASAMEIINGKPVFYSMGNFIFDQNWSVETSEGLVIESTFIGSRLVSTRMLPTVILKQSQPNFVDVATDGVPIMNRVWKGSKGLPRW